MVLKTEPLVVFGFGSFVSAPGALAATLGGPGIFLGRNAPQAKRYPRFPHPRDLKKVGVT